MLSLRSSTVSTPQFQGLLHRPKYAQYAGDWMFKHMSHCETFCTPRITEVMGTLTPCSFLWKLEPPELKLRLCDMSSIPFAFSLSHLTLISGSWSPLDSPVKLLQPDPFSAVSWVWTDRSDSADDCSSSSSSVGPAFVDLHFECSMSKGR